MARPPGCQGGRRWLLWEKGPMRMTHRGSRVCSGGRPSQTSPLQMTTRSPTGRVTSSQVLTYANLDFFICKVGTRAAPIT